MLWNFRVYVFTRSRSSASSKALQHGSTIYLHSPSILQIWLYYLCASQLLTSDPPRGPRWIPSWFEALGGNRSNSWRPLPTSFAFYISANTRALSKHSVMAFTFDASLLLLPLRTFPSLSSSFSSSSSPLFNTMNNMVHHDISTASSVYTAGILSSFKLIFEPMTYFNSRYSRTQRTSCSTTRSWPPFSARPPLRQQTTSLFDITATAVVGIVSHRPSRLVSS